MPAGAFYWLGSPRVEVEGRPVRLETRKTTALLAFLSVERRPHSREYLAALLWPEYDSVRAPANLRRVLSSLQQSLGDGWLSITRDTLAFEPAGSVSVDYSDFITRLRDLRKSFSDGEASLDDTGAVKLREALALYRGDFLQGFNLKDCPEFDRWQMIIRDEAQRLADRALEGLVEYHTAVCRWDDALEESRRRLSLDNLNEAAHRSLMFLLAKTGKRNAALKQYEICVRLLGDELGQDPEEETSVLAENIRRRRIEVPEAGRTAGGAARSPAEESLVEGSLLIRSTLPKVRSKLVDRSRLFTLLDEGSRRPVTLVSAPAGFGKTTLVADWAARRKIPVVWLSLEEGDDAPHRFLTALASALAVTASPAGTEALRMLKSAQVPPITMVTESLLKDLARKGAPSHLVLDDYHLITDTQTQELFSQVVRRLPRDFHLIIATRVDPAIALSQLRARDQLVEVRADDLRFSVSEASAFLRDIMDLGLEAGDIETLERRTEGWAAGLQMAALSLRGRSDCSAFINDFGGSHRYIMDYLMDEVLAGQPKEIHDFLLKTSILKRFNTDLCDRVTGLAGSRDILETLDRENLFLVSLDDKRAWYRYHHLFAELLRHRLRQKSSPEEISALHHLAGKRLEEAGDIEGAMDHYLTGALHGEALRVLTEQHDEMIARGGLVTMMAWAAAIPPEETRQDPKACGAFGTIYAFAGRGEEAGRYFARAEELLDKTEETEETRRLRGEISAIGAFMADVTGDNQKAVNLAKRADCLLPPDIHMGRALAAYVMSKECRRGGDYDGADQWCVKLIGHARAAGNIWPLAGAVYERAALRLVRGRLREAETLVKDFENEPREPGSEGPCAKITALRAEIELERGNPRQAREISRRAVEDVMPWGLPSDVAACLLTRLRCELSAGRLAAAEEDLERIDALVRTSQVYATMVPMIEAERVLLLLAGGKVEEAISWSQNFQCPDDWSPALKEIHTLSRCRVLIAAGRNSEALTLLAGLAEEAEKAGRYYRLLEILILLAAAGTGEEADKALKRALSIAQGEGFVRVFLLEGEAVLERLKTLTNDSGSLQPHLSEYALRIVSLSP
ncbi:MAG: hypothetical protein JW760_08005 [Spirochaetales bacterium]|nr:hypothetical protein [Spirochaetales bacterium]